MPRFFNRNRRTNSQIDSVGQLFVSGECGVVAADIYHSTGAATAMHEVVGHGMLGMRLTSDYPHGTGPTYWNADFERFHKIQHANSIAASIQRFFAWLFIPSSGQIGWANQGPDYHPNDLAHHLGPEKTSAWISISGSIPGLLLDATFVSSAMLLRKKYPTLSFGLLVFGIMDNIMSAGYALDAALMSTTELKAAARHGHDFANFAVQMSHTTHLSAPLIAISTALFWTGIIPLIILAIWLYQNSYPSDEPRQVLSPYLQRLSERSQLEIYLAYATLALILLGLVEQILTLLANTIVPCLLPIVIILQTILPVLGIISIFSSGYATMRDLHLPDTELSPTAKILSCLKLAVTTVMVSLLIAATFAIGMHFLFFPVALVGTLLLISIEFAKYKVIQNPHAPAIDIRQHEDCGANLVEATQGMNIFESNRFDNNQSMPAI